MPLSKPTCSPNRAAMNCGLHGWVLPCLYPNPASKCLSAQPLRAPHGLSWGITQDSCPCMSPPPLLPTQPSECPIHQGPSHPRSLAATGTTPLPPLICLCPCPSNWDGGSLRARPILCPAHPTSAAGCMNEAHSQDRQPVFCPLGDSVPQQGPTPGAIPHMSPSPGSPPAILHVSPNLAVHLPRARCLPDSLRGLVHTWTPSSFQVLSQNLSAPSTLTPPQIQHGSKSPWLHLPINTQSGHPPTPTAAPRSALPPSPGPPQSVLMGLPAPPIVHSP